MSDEAQSLFVGIPVKKLSLSTPESASKPSNKPSKKPSNNRKRRSDRRLDFESSYIELFKISGALNFDICYI